MKSYTASINYDTGSMRQELVREMGTIDAARRRRAVHRRAASDSARQRQLRLEPARLPRLAPPRRHAAPAPGNARRAHAALWATPQGFVKAAMANNATTKKAKGGTEVSFTVGGKYKMTGMINAQNQVERVQTWIDQPIVGDMLVETIYSGYKDFGGVHVPIAHRPEAGRVPALDLTIASVTQNPPVDITVPDNVRNAPPPPPVQVDLGEARRRRLLPDRRHAPQPRRRDEGSHRAGRHAADRGARAGGDRQGEGS